MAQTIKLKRSATSGATPTTSQLELGEVAINTYDGKMYIKKNVGGTESIVEITGGSGGSSTLGGLSDVTISSAAADQLLQYNGSEWVNVSIAEASAIMKEYQFTATSGQSTFSGSDDNSETLSYTAGAIQVFLNGIFLDSAVDYTATNGTSIVLSETVDSNDYLQVVAFKKKIGDGSVSVDTFTGNGSTTAFTLSVDPGDENNTRVFVDGVYQSKSNYSVSGTTLTFSTAPPADTAVEVEIGNRVVTLDTLSNLDLPDNVQLRLGTGQDLKLYHTGSHGLITNSTGDIRYQSNTRHVFSDVGFNETHAIFNDNGAVNLYHDNSLKFATTSSGISVTGNIANTSGDMTLDVIGDIILDADGGDIRLADSGTQFGKLSNNGTDLVIESLVSNRDIVFKGADGSSVINALILDMSNAGKATFNHGATFAYTTTHYGNGAASLTWGNTSDVGALSFSGSNAIVRSSVSNADLIFEGNSNGLFEALRLDMSAAGTAIFNSHVDLSDSKYLRLGNDADFIIYHDGSTNYVQAVKQDSDIIFRGNDGGTNFNALTLDMSDVGTAHFNGHIRLGDNRTASFGAGYDIEITSDGTNGTIGAPNGNLTLDVAGDIITSADINFGDSDKAVFGAGSDLQIYHNGLNSIIDNTGTGSLIIQDTDGTGDILIRPKSGQTAIAAYNDNTVELGYAGSVKLATTSTGIDVTGRTATDNATVGSGTASTYVDLTVNGASTANYGPMIELQSAGTAFGKISNYGRIQGGTSTDMFVTTATTNNLLLGTNNTRAIQISSGGDISFYEDTATTAKFFWDASEEKLGIGTTTATAALTVNHALPSGHAIAEFRSTGNTTSSVVVRADGTGDSNIQFSLNGVTPFAIGVDNSDGDKFKISDSYQLGTNDRFVIDGSSGNVGIGTSSPNAGLEVLKAGGGKIRISETASRYVEILGYAEGTANGSTMAFQTIEAGTSTSTERMRINHSGNVGIGTNNPGEKLVIKGTTSFMATNSTNRWMAYTYTDNTFRLNYNGAGADEFIMDSSGNAGIGTAGSSSGIQLQIGNNSNNSAVTRVTNGTVHVDLTASSSGKAFLEVGTAHPLVLATNATERMRIDSSGNVGIGTTFPASKLTVNTGGVSGNTASFSSGATTSGNHSGITINAYNINGVEWYGSEIRNILTASTPSYLNPRLGFFTQDNNTHLPSDRTEKMSILGNGRVGIGTTAPSATLHMENSSGATLFMGDTNGRNLRFRTANSGSQNTNISAYATLHLGGADNQNHLSIDGNGNVGIGTTSPSYPLTILGSHTIYAGNVATSSTATTSYNVIRFTQGAGSGAPTGMIGTGGSATGNSGFAGAFAVGTQNSAPLTFLTSDTERMRIDSSGQLLLGRGANVASGAEATRIQFYNTNSTYDIASIRSVVGAGQVNRGELSFAVNNGAGQQERMRLDYSGNLLVGGTTINAAGSFTIRPNSSNGSCSVQINRADTTATSNAFVFYNNGSAVGGITYNNASTAFNTSSDQRLKENIVDAPSASDDIDAIQVRSFDWKVDGSHQKYGMVAQELQGVAPEAVSGDAESEEMMGVDYSKLVPMLVKALQESRQEINNLKSRVEELESQ